MLKEQKGYPYSKRINFNATEQNSKRFNWKKDLSGPIIPGGYSSEIFTEEIGKEYAQAEGRPSSAPVLLEGLLKHGWPHP